MRQELESVADALKVLPWRAVVNPAVHVARNGFQGIALMWEKGEHADGMKVTEDLVRYMREAQYYANGSFLIEDPGFAVDFAPNGMTIGPSSRYG